MNLATLKSLGGVAAVLLGAFNAPSMPSNVREAFIVAGAWVVGLFVHKTASPASVPVISVHNSLPDNPKVGA